MARDEMHGPGFLRSRWFYLSCWYNFLPAPGLVSGGNCNILGLVSALHMHPARRDVILHKITASCKLLNSMGCLAVFLLLYFSIVVMKRCRGLAVNHNHFWKAFDRWSTNSHATTGCWVISGSPEGSFVLRRQMDEKPPRGLEFDAGRNIERSWTPNWRTRFGGDGRNHVWGLQDFRT